MSGVDKLVPECTNCHMNTMRPYLMMNRPGMLKSRGVLRYDPYRGRMTKNTKYWLVVETDPEINRYMRFIVDRNLLNITMEPGFGLNQPSGGPHISVIRGERDVRSALGGGRVPQDHIDALWGKYDGREVDFLYDLNIRHSGDTTGDRPGHYWFVNVQCPFLTEIREEFDLPRDWRFHLTIGRTYDR